MLGGHWESQGALRAMGGTGGHWEALVVMGGGVWGHWEVLGALGQDNGCPCRTHGEGPALLWGGGGQCGDTEGCRVPPRPPCLQRGVPPRVPRGR